LYELKQVPKQWHQKFDELILKNGFHINDADKCVYTKFTNDKGVIICLYIDDMLIFGIDIEQIKNTKIFLSQNFDMKDLGEADAILGIKITRVDNGLIISQSHHFEKALKRFNTLDCKLYLHLLM